MTFLHDVLRGDFERVAVPQRQSGSSLAPRFISRSSFIISFYALQCRPAWAHRRDCDRITGRRRGLRGIRDSCYRRLRSRHSSASSCSSLPASCGARRERRPSRVRCLQRWPANVYSAETALEEFVCAPQDLAKAFIRLTAHDTFPLDQLSRYEYTLWR